MKRLVIAAATAAALSVGTLAPVPAVASEAPIVNVGSNYGGQWNGGYNGGNGNWNGGNGHWNGGKDWNHGNGKWKGQPKWHAKKSCEPIVRWQRVGYGWHKKWVPIVVGWDCHRGRGHRW